MKSTSVVCQAGESDLCFIQNQRRGHPQDLCGPGTCRPLSPAERSPSSWVECAACSSHHNHFLFSLEARLRGPILHEKRGGFICSHFPIHLRLGSVASVQALPRLDPGCTAPARRGAVPAKRPPRRLFPRGPGRAPPLCANPSHLHLTTIKTFRSLRRFLPLIIT